MTINPVVHFEMGYQDKQRMADFYGQAFGWKSQMFGPEIGNYVVVYTTEVDSVSKRPTQTSCINGFFPLRVPTILNILLW